MSRVGAKSPTSPSITPEITERRAVMNIETNARNPADNLKSVIAANIIELRRKHNLTQLDLAEKLNYTDKAISKWERGESLPDITVLKTIADMFGVTVDYLLQASHEEVEEKPDPIAEEHSRARAKRARGFITGMSVLLVWLAATVLFIILDMIPLPIYGHWLVFLSAVPVSCIVWLVMNSIWFNRRRNYLIISLLMWSALVLTYLIVLCYADYHIWQVFLMGIPGQAIIIMWSNINKGKKARKEGNEQ